jgi:acylphosphatase
MSDKRAFHAQVSGRVQGVGFRYTCHTQARRLGLCGWVQNLPNGDVEVWAEGDAAKLESLRQWLQQGPPGSRVESLQCDDLKPTGKYRTFEIN